MIAHSFRHWDNPVQIVPRHFIERSFRKRMSCNEYLQGKVEVYGFITRHGANLNAPANELKGRGFVDVNDFSHAVSRLLFAASAFAHPVVIMALTKRGIGA